MFKFFKFISFVSIASVLVLVIGKELPPSLKLCGRNDENFLQCVKEDVQESIVLFKDDIADLETHSTDPMLIKEVEIKSNDKIDLFNLVQTYSNIEVRGFSTATVQEARGEFNDKKCHLAITTTQPKMELIGDYKMDGRFMIFSVHGSGKVNISIEGLHSVGTLKCEFFKENDEKFMRVLDITAEIKPSQILLNYTNLFDGNAELSAKINNFLNEHWKEFFPELKDSFEGAFAKHFLELARTVVKDIPESKLFLN